jgi:hypothetical protein
MEWHADGTAGEATVLLSLADVSRETGALGIVPRSHAGYSTRKAAAGGPGARPAADAAESGDAAEQPVAANTDAAPAEDDDEDQAARIMAACPPPVWYAYRAGAPAVLDARTLHCAADNSSDALRAVAWFIYNQYEEEEAAEEGEDAAADDGAAGEATAALAALAVA